MNRYEPELPRFTFGAAAIALAALTLGLLVGLPAHVASGLPETGALVARGADSRAPVGVAMDPARIDVVTQRDRGRAFGLVRHLPGAKDAAS